MIKTKKDLLEYLKCDFENNFFTKYSSIKKFIIRLRKTEYYLNTGKKIRFLLSKFFFKNMQDKYLTYIGLNCFQKGLSIAHLGGIYINNQSKFGEFCRISQNVTVGSTNGSNASPKVGNYVFIGANSSIIGDITIADYVCVGANSCVVKNIEDSHTTWGGVPAKKISNNDSTSNIYYFSKEQNK